jgi:O-acetyl-ADP-ribose deacetylase (regulator of RNase III)
MLDTVTAFIRRWRMKTIKPFGRTSPDGIQISLGDLNPDIANALAVAFAGVDHAEVVQGNLLDLHCDAILSPANSFGDMGGGIDKAIDDFHRGAAQRAVTAAITEQWFGELPVGAALIVKLSSRRLPFVVAAPTMRIPGNVGETINAYLSMRAALIAVLRHNASGGHPIRSLAIPGLCTGVGGMAYERASEQMRTAYESVIGGRWQKVVHPAMAPYALGERLVIWNDRTDIMP